MIKTQSQILQDLTTDTIAEQDEVTFFGKSGVLRAILSALSNVLAEIWNDVTQIKRSIQLQTAVSSDLDAFGNRRSISRFGATNGSVILLFNGPAGTIIPSGTIISSSASGVQYATSNDITLGASNPNIQRPVYSNALGDIVLAESVNTGSSVRVGIRELTQLQTAITGVTVTNLVPSNGALDAETDEEYRNRIQNIVDSLSLGTIAFYTALAQAANPAVLRVLPVYNARNGGVDLYLAKNSLGDFTTDELTSIATYVYSKQKSLCVVTCYNALRLSIELEAFVTTTTGVVFETEYANLAAQISNLINPEFGSTISYYDLFQLFAKDTNITNVDIPSFLVNNGKSDIICAYNQIPSFTFFSLKNQNIDKIETIQQSYLVLQ